jgi:hypothetical protein
VRFDRAGDRVLAVLENWQYRSSDTANAAHQRSVAERFPRAPWPRCPSWGGEGGRIVVDATDFFVRDWMDVPRTLQRAGQGAYAVARDRSGLYRPQHPELPRNTEVDVSLTFAAQNAREGSSRASAPTARVHLRAAPVARAAPAGYAPRRRTRGGYSASASMTKRSPSTGRCGALGRPGHRLERAPTGASPSPSSTTSTRGSPSRCGPRRCRG